MNTARFSFIHCPDISFAKIFQMLNLIRLWYKDMEKYHIVNIIPSYLKF